MAAKKKKDIIPDGSAEERILQAARTVFLRKGYAAARTRDIAEEAGLNIALLHYYFRSKEKLFEMVMLETLQQFAAGMIEMLNSTKTSLQGKLTILADRYIDLLIRQPELPLFIITEVRNNPDHLISKLGIREALMQSVFLQQLAAMSKQSNSKAEPLQLFLSVLGMTIFPFVAKPVVQAVFGIHDEAFIQKMQERRKLIPAWIETLLETS
jgi:AcrR family transcriptional regulator